VESRSAVAAVHRAFDIQAPGAIALGVEPCRFGWDFLPGLAFELQRRIRVLVLFRRTSYREAVS